MKSEVASKAETSTSDQLHMSSPLASRALFWRARYRRASGFLYHMPLAFWLTDVARPSVLVELGLGNGQSYFGFCQAMERLNIAGRCYGFSEDSQSDTLQGYNQENYEEFSTIISRSATAALRGFQDGAIDFLVINADLPEETLRTLSDIWDKKLSDRGVLLIQNYQDQTYEDGMQSMIAELTKGKPSITFDQGSGATVILHGSQQDARLQQMAEIEFGTPEHNIVNSIFSRLGSSHYHEWRSHKFEQEVRAERKKSKQALADLEESTNTLEAARAELGDLKTAFEKRNEKIAEMQVALFDLQKETSQEISNLRDQLSSLQGELKDEQKARLQEAYRADAANAELDTARKQATETEKTLNARIEETALKLQEAEKARDSAEKKHQEDKLVHEDEIVALTKKLEETDTEYQSLLSAHEDLKKRFDETTRELEGAKKARDDADAERDQLQQQAERTETRQAEEIAALTKRLWDTKETTQQQEAERHVYSEKLRALTEQKAYDDRYREIQLTLRERLIDQLQSRKQTGLTARMSQRNLKTEAEIVSQSPHFDAGWYLATYPDVKESGADPALHFLSKGLYEGRNPGPEFDCVAYYIAHPDALENGVNPLVHAAQSDSAT